MPKVFQGSRPMLVQEIAAAEAGLVVVLNGPAYPMYVAFEARLGTSGQGNRPGYSSVVNAEFCPTHASTASFAALSALRERCSRSAVEDVALFALESALTVYQLTPVSAIPARISSAAPLCLFLLFLIP